MTTDRCTLAAAINASGPWAAYRDAAGPRGELGRGDARHDLEVELGQPLDAGELGFVDAADSAPLGTPVAPAAPTVTDSL